MIPLATCTIPLLCLITHVSSATSAGGIGCTDGPAVLEPAPAPASALNFAAIASAAFFRSSSIFAKPSGGASALTTGVGAVSGEIDTPNPGMPDTLELGSGPVALMGKVGGGGGGSGAPAANDAGGGVKLVGGAKEGGADWKCGIAGGAKGGGTA